jgi:glycosyltransferase involved in cell wall biosynthesis
MSTKSRDDISIAMIIPNFPPLSSGGAELQCLKLSRALIREGVRVLVVTQGQRNLPKNDVVDGVPVYRIFSILNSLWQLLARFKKKLIKPRKTKTIFDYSSATTAESPGQKIHFFLICYAIVFCINAFFVLWKRRHELQLIHVHSLEWAGITGAIIGKLLNKPVLIKDATMNGIERLQKYPFGLHLQKFIIDNCYCIALTRAIEKTFTTTGVSSNRIFRIPNGIELPDDRPLKPNFEFKALFVGNLYQQPAKGIDILLKAWPLVLHKFPQATLEIVGDGNLDDYRKHIENLGIASSVCFLGKVIRITEKYLSADIFVLSSRREGMSNALIEAMAHGLPCVATDISGSQDLIKPGENGILVPVDDVEKLADGILYLFANPDQARQMGIQARATIEQTCDFKKVVPQYLNIYRKLTC